MILTNRDIYLSVSPKSSKAMKTPPSTCLFFLTLCCLAAVTRSRTLLLNNCAVNVHLEELNRYYYSIRLNAVGEKRADQPPQMTSILTLCAFFGFQITGDDEIGVKFLNKSLIDDVQVRFFFLNFFPHKDALFFF